MRNRLLIVLGALILLGLIGLAYVKIRPARPAVSPAMAAALDAPDSAERLFINVESLRRVPALAPVARCLNDKGERFGSVSGAVFFETSRWTEPTCDAQDGDCDGRIGEGIQEDDSRRGIHAAIGYLGIFGSPDGVRGALARVRGKHAAPALQRITADIYAVQPWTPSFLPFREALLEAGRAHLHDENSPVVLRLYLEADGARVEIDIQGYTAAQRAGLDTVLARIAAGHPDFDTAALSRIVKETRITVEGPDLHVRAFLPWATLVRTMNQCPST